MSDTNLPRPQISVVGAIVMVVVGAFLSVILGFVLAFAMTILSTAEFHMPYLWLAISGVVLGPAVSLTRFRGRTSPLLSAGIGLVVGVIWLVATGFDPVSMAGSRLIEIAGPPVIFTLAGYVSRKALREVNLEQVTRDARDKLLVRMLRAVGIIVYLVIVAIPFYFM